MFFWWAIETLAIKASICFTKNVDRLLLSPAKQRGRDFGMLQEVSMEMDMTFNGEL